MKKPMAWHLGPTSLSERRLLNYEDACWPFRVPAMTIEVRLSSCRPLPVIDERGKEEKEVTRCHYKVMDHTQVVHRYCRNVCQLPRRGNAVQYQHASQGEDTKVPHGAIR